MKTQAKMRQIEREIRDNLVLQSDRKIFVSYSSKDREFAEKVCGALQFWGHGIWIDRIEMQKGLPSSEIETRLYESIRTADCLLVLLSKNSISSEWVRKEYAEAIRLQEAGARLLVLPGIIDDCHIPDDLQTGKYIDLRKDFDSAVLDIVSNLE